MTVGDKYSGLPGPIELNAKIGDLKEIKVKAARLRDLATRTLVPSIGLHISLLASISLFQESQQNFLAMLPLFSLALILVIFHRIYNGPDGDIVVASRRATAIFGLFILSAAAVTNTARTGLSDGSNTLVVGLFLVASFGTISYLCWKGRVEPLGMVVALSYSIICFIVFGKADNFILILAMAVPCLLIAALVIVRLERRGYMLGVAFAGLVAIGVGSAQRGVNPGVLLAAGLLLLIPIFMVEQNKGKDGFSDLLRFLALGVAITALSLSITAFKPNEIGTVFFVAGVFFSVYTVVAWQYGGIEGRPIRFAWMAILFSLTAISLDAYHIAYLLCAISLLTVSLIYGNEFVRVLAGMFGGLGLWLVVDQLRTAIDYLFIGERYDPRALETPPNPSVNLLFCLATLLVITSLIISRFRLPPTGRPWWHGLVRRRHAATLRQIFRTVESKLKDVPVVGWIYGILEAALKSLRFAKGDGTSVNKYDVLQVLAFVGAALAMTYFLTPIIFEGIGTTPPRFGWAMFLAVLISWLSCGLALAAWGSVAQSLFHTLLAFVFFSAPILSHLVGQTLLVGSPLNGAQFHIMLIFWACPLFLVSLLPKMKRTR